jgi:hypothetical protein
VRRSSELSIEHDRNWGEVAHRAYLLSKVYITDILHSVGFEIRLGNFCIIVESR